MRYFRRLAKFGFTNAPFKTQFWTVNLGDIIAHPAFAKGGEVSVATLVKAGLVRDDSRELKVLGGMPKKAGGLKVALKIVAHRCSDSARKMVTDAGGTVNELGTRRDKVRGIDRNSDDRKPKNLTKKLKRNTENKAKLAKLLAEGPAKGDAKPEAEAAKPKGDGPKAEAKPKAEGAKGEGKPAKGADKGGDKK